MKKQVIAVLATTAGLTAAMQAKMTERFPDAEFVNIDKLSEKPPGAKVVSLGIPSYTPGGESISGFAFQNRLIENATPADRSRQWTTLRAPDSTEAECAAELGTYNEYKVLGNKSIASLKEKHMDAREALLDESSPEKQVAILKAALRDIMDLIG